ncbi:hypothetical protein CR513_53569, partial [Mucuna pruriens]
MTLKKNSELFAWKPSNMPRIDPYFLCHKLALCVEAKPVAQKKRKTRGEIRVAMEGETTKLKEARGVEANLDKCEAIINMKSSQNTKEVPKLASQLASLSRFLPKEAEKAQPSFQLLKKPMYFGVSPILTKPLEWHKLCLYLVVSKYAVSVVMVQEQGKKQTPIYCTSKVLQEAQTRYHIIEKLVLGLVTSARRLRPYFHLHTIIIRTNHPIQQVLWKLELADGLLNPKGGGAGIILEGLGKLVLENSLKFDCKTSNNQAEYEALLAGLDFRSRCSKCALQQ